MRVLSAKLEVAAPMDQHADRRPLRSRLSLMEALGKLLERKGFDDIPVQEIVDKADLTRATFYLHYSDKAALLESLTEASYGKMLKNATSCPQNPLDDSRRSR